MVISVEPEQQDGAGAQRTNRSPGQMWATVRRPAARGASTPSAARPRPKGLSWDHFLLGQIPLALATALLVAMVSYAVIAHLPPGSRLAGAPAPGAGNGGGVAKTFSSEVAAQQLTIAADPGGALKWDKSSYEARAGDITFLVDNPSPLPHNFAVEGPGVRVQSKDFGPRTTNTFTLKDLPPGEYLLICNYPGHREAGMVSTLIVK
jgi:uncharacterized cupredoxin-like copper-binding protein